MITVWGKPFSFNGQSNPTTYSCDWKSCVDKCYDDTKCLLVHTDSSETCVVYTIGDVQLVSNQKLNPSSSKDKTTFRITSAPNTCGPLEEMLPTMIPILNHPTYIHFNVTTASDTYAIGFKQPDAADFTFPLTSMFFYDKYKQSDTGLAVTSSMAFLQTFYEPVDFEIAKLRCQTYGNGFMIATASLTQKVVNDTIERNKNRDSIPEQDFLHIGLVRQDDNTWVWTTPELDYKSEGIPWASGEPKQENKCAWVIKTRNVDSLTLVSHL
ncbi:hypothetical protein CRE_16084 [Caenorhabditis remanei]|uniref:PAN-3 domain-containing protein n=1 Tax=Caenorhabditis remanei TaxID=31234 RepID=E3MBQ3_CAERE|nr:hypothetical protein CRE_16084 [Caenorhabditis remanei]